MDFSNIYEKKTGYAKYMVKEITHIIKNFEKRPPGSKGEKQACEYMADVLKKLGCETKIEPFELNPGSFYGWIYITVTLGLIAILGFVINALKIESRVIPAIGAVLIFIGLLVAFLQFGLYKKAIDPLFPKKTSHNVTAFKKPTGEVKRRIIFNGHPDATWEWPVNYALGGIAFEGHAIICGIGAIYYAVISILYAVKGATPTLTKCGYWGLLFVPFLIGLYFMWNERRVVDGANDNLSGCYMGIAILKALQDEDIELENTEIGVVLTGSEESGLRGAMAWCEAHKGEFDDVPTFIYSFDTIHDPKHLLVNYRDLNATVKADKDVSDLFMEAAREIGVTCKKGMVPPLGGATDSAAFAKAGFRATGITGLNHNLERYYHTRLDTWNNMNTEGLADCFAAAVRVLEKFDQGAKQ